MGSTPSRAVFSLGLAEPPPLLGAPGSAGGDSPQHPEGSAEPRALPGCKEQGGRAGGQEKNPWHCSHIQAVAPSQQQPGDGGGQGSHRGSYLCSTRLSLWQPRHNLPCDVQAPCNAGGPGLRRMRPATAETHSDALLGHDPARYGSEPAQVQRSCHGRWVQTPAGSAPSAQRHCWVLDSCRVGVLSSIPHSPALSLGSLS